MKQLIRYLIWLLPLFAAYNSQAQNNTVYGAGISYTNGVPTWTPNPRTSRAAVDTVTGRWYHFNTPGGWQWIGNTVEEIAGCTAPAYTPDKGDSRLVINNCAKPQLYWYDGAVWKWINEGTTYFAGEGIRIENDTIILDSLYVLRFRTGDTTDLNAGAVSWNAGEQTLDVVINQGAVTGQMFQEVLYFTKNQTGAQIDDGTVVMAAGTTGNSGKILIAPAIADGSVNSEYILGLATQDLPNGGEGMVTHFGKVRGIQTNGANFGETWVDGDVLYCSASTPGYLTKVLPIAPNLKVPIAIVIHAHPSNGTLFVRPSHFPDLAQINDVQLSSPTNGQVLTYNATLSRWENATPANQLQALSTDGTPGNISISSGNTITLNVNDADASATNELQTLSLSGSDLSISGGNTVTLPATGLTGNGISPFVAQYNSTNTLDTTGIVWNGGRMGVGLTTTSPSARFHVRGQGNTSTTWTAQFHNSGGSNNALMIRDDGRVSFGTASPSKPFHVSGEAYFASALQLEGGLKDNRDNVFLSQSLNSVASNRDLIVGNALYKRIRLHSKEVYISGSFPASEFLFYVDGGTGNGAIDRQGIYMRPTQPAVGGNTAGGDVIIELPNGTGTGRKGAVLIGSATATGPSAILELNSTDRGLLFPRMTTAQRDLIATPADGLVIYNTTDNKLQVRAAGAWVDLH